MALGFSIPLDFSVVTPGSLADANWLLDDGVDRLWRTTPLFHDGWIAVTVARVVTVLLLIFSILMGSMGHISAKQTAPKTQTVTEPTVVARPSSRMRGFDASTKCVRPVHTSTYIQNEAHRPFEQDH